jgi:hypothetical protein
MNVRSGRQGGTAARSFGEEGPQPMALVGAISRP